jgi:hypothetical protein
MAGQNTLILATDYNVIQSKIASVMGEGSGTKGYGQTIASSQVGQFAKITASQWNNLRSDILRARQHQTGQDMSSNLIVAGPNITISDSQRDALLGMAVDAENPVNYLVSPPPAPTEGGIADLVPEQIRTQPWNGKITQTVTVSWPTADDARYFFNSGGNITFDSKFFASATAGPKGTSWSTLLDNIGTIRFDYNRAYTDIPDPLTFTSPQGFYTLSTIPTIIAQRETSSSAYIPNEYFIVASVNSTLANERRILTFVINWNDSSVAPPSFPDPGFGIDEDVEGTLTSIVEVIRSINNVVIPTPSATTTSIG